MYHMYLYIFSYYFMLVRVTVDLVSLLISIQFGKWSHVMKYCVQVPSFKNRGNKKILKRQIKNKLS